MSLIPSDGQFGGQRHQFVERGGTGHQRSVVLQGQGSHRVGVGRRGGVNQGRLPFQLFQPGFQGFEVGAPQDDAHAGRAGRRLHQVDEGLAPLR